MQGNKDVIAGLKEALVSEFTAIHQYVTEARQFKRNGYKKLAKAEMKLAYAEMAHAELLMDRLALFGATMDTETDSGEVDKEIGEVLDADLAAEEKAAGIYKRLIAACVKAGDDDTRTLAEGILEDETEHIREIEGMQKMLGDVGTENFLSMMG